MAPPSWKEEMVSAAAPAARLVAFQSGDSGAAFLVRQALLRRAGGDAKTIWRGLPGLLSFRSCVAQHSVLAHCSAAVLCAVLKVDPAANDPQRRAGFEVEEVS